MWKISRDVARPPEFHGLIVDTRLSRLTPERVRGAKRARGALGVCVTLE